jgi:diphthamide synthase (EF-2-diphthine--ammonia ligase)
LNQQLVDEFPPGIDPCGENGEFHTFVYDGPMFANAIPVKSGNVVTRDGFVFIDLSLPASAEAREKANVRN